VTELTAQTVIVSLSTSQSVTGPGIDLAIALIDRMKKLFASSKGIAAAFSL
jgi:hypothetical protein